jgi:UDP-N-acetyl-D-glucosamine dehydrogenase
VFDADRDETYIAVVSHRDMRDMSIATVGVIGLGYVGLPLAVAFAREGCEVIAVDVDPRKIEAIEAGRSYIEDVPSEELAAVASRIHASTRYARLAKADAVLVCVPTPLTENREPDLGPLVECARGLSEVLQQDQLVILESTTYPGTTRERFAPLLEESGLAAGRDFHLAFSPERVDPGRSDYTLRNTPKVLGGLTDACAERAEALYGIVCEQIVRVSNPETAELSKLLENIFRSVNIALVNELAMLTDRMGIDVWEVLEAAATKPYGFMRFEPGPGMGGHCLPVDPFYLSWRAREYDMSTEFIELAGKVNQQMPYHCVTKAQRTLNDAGLPVKGARITILGVSYKAGVGDVRESPALKILQLLRNLGAELSYHDPHVPTIPDLGLHSIPLDDALANADLAVIVTAHPSVDHQRVARRARLLLDLRGVTRTRSASATGNVVRL